MNTAESFTRQIPTINNETFDEFALKLFHFQSQKNEIYKTFLQNIGIDTQKVKNVKDIPFLPINFFKEFAIKTGDWQEEVIFESSGTTGQTASRHYLRDTAFYRQISRSIFEQRYGALEDFVVLALLPSYLERGNSSLVYMVDYFIQQSGSSHSGFYLYNYEELSHELALLKEQNQKTLLIGVTYALLEFAEKFPVSFPGLMVMETGGMKGRGKELVRQEVHSRLRDAFCIQTVHSEYGMTELLSQAYSSGMGRYYSPSWMKVLIREINDPFQWESPGRSGGINIIDLANVDSCAFIETKDLGKANEDGSFEVLGRFDNSEIRGCNLLFA